MYIPEFFVFNDTAEQLAFIEQWSFGQLLTVNQGRLTVNHVPFILDRDQLALYGHLALQNSQYSDLEHADELLVIFNGPNAYVSPGWYDSREMVPTWNFQAVHVKGRASLADADELIMILEKLSSKHEAQFAQPWQINQVSEGKLANMLQAIGGFKIAITAMAGKSKLSQNRSLQDQQGVIRGLKKQNEAMAMQIAELMEATIKKNLA